MTCKNTRFDLSPYNDHGKRMLAIVVYALQLDWPARKLDTAEALGKYARDYKGEITGTPEEWNKAAGFVYAYWESGSNITPFDDSYDFAELVNEHMGAGYDGSWDYSIYDANGQKRFLDIKIVATMNDRRDGLTYEKYQEKLKADEAKKAQRKAQADARKKKKEAEKAKALAKLTPKERKALGL